MKTYIKVRLKGNEIVWIGPGETQTDALREYELWKEANPTLDKLRILATFDTVGPPKPCEHEIVGYCNLCRR